MISCLPILPYENRAASFNVIVVCYDCMWSCPFTTTTEAKVEMLNHKCEWRLLTSEPEIKIEVTNANDRIRGSN